MVLEISQTEFQIVSARERPWYMYVISCQGLYAFV